MLDSPRSFSAWTLFVSLALALLFTSAADAQKTCRWDGSAPYCAGSCNVGETEELQASSNNSVVQSLPSINAFGDGCIFGTKSYCCSTPGVTCRWDGTAPFCEGECDKDEEQTDACTNCIGKPCWTGKKVRCCKATGSTGQPLTATVDDARYAAIWDKSTGPAWSARHGMTSSEFQAAFIDKERKGHRLVHLAGYGVGEAAYYAAIWEETGGPPQATRHGLTASQFQTEFDALGANGFRLVHVSAYAVNGEGRYAGIWHQTSGPAWVARHGMTSEEYQNEFDALVGRGYRLVKVSGFGVDGDDYYAAIWEMPTSTSSWEARHGLTSEGYQQQFNLLGQNGYRLVHLSAYAVDGESRFAAIWEQVTGPEWAALHGMTSDGYQEEFNYKAKDGYRLQQVSGYHAW